MIKTKIAREYRERFPDLPSLTLARKIYKDNPIVYKSVEDARSCIRYIEGKTGAKDRKHINMKHTPTARPLNPWKLPESYQEKREPFVLPAACHNILLISDIHIPYHDIDAVSIALDYGIENKVNTIFINGDLIDFHKISRFQTDPRKRSVKQEFEATDQFLTILRNAFPDAQIYWHYGNHDMRYEHWLMSKCVEIFDDEYYHLEHRLQLVQKKIHIISDKQLTKAGKLTIAHGHHIFKGVFTPVNPSRGAFLRAKQSMIVGHLHRPSHHPETTADGEVISCWSTGCLCELKPDYSPQISNSMHGFAHIQIDKEKKYHVKNFTIINGKLY